MSQNVIDSKPRTLLDPWHNNAYSEQIAQEIDKQRDHYSNKFVTIEANRAKYADVSQNYFPERNKKNIQERNLVNHKVPSTRDRYIGNPLT